MDAAATLAAQGANKMDSRGRRSLHLVRTYIYLHLHIYIWHLWSKQEAGRSLHFAGKYIYIYHICGPNKETRKIPPFCSKVHLCLVSVIGTHICVGYRWRQTRRHGYFPVTHFTWVVSCCCFASFELSLSSLSLHSFGVGVCALYGLKLDETLTSWIYSVSGNEGRNSKFCIFSVFCRICQCLFREGIDLYLPPQVAPL